MGEAVVLALGLLGRGKRSGAGAALLAAAHAGASAATAIAATAIAATAIAATAVAATAIAGTKKERAEGVHPSVAQTACEPGPIHRRNGRGWRFRQGTRGQ